jgi:hypothetical protein
MRILSIFFFTTGIFFVIGCDSHDKDIERKIQKNSQINIKEAEQSKDNKLQKKEVIIRQELGKYTGFIPYQPSITTEPAEGEYYGIMLPSTPNTYFEVTIKPNQKIVFFEKKMNRENTEMMQSSEMEGDYRIVKDLVNLIELECNYNPSWVEVPEKHKIVIDKKKGTIIYTRYGKEIVLEKIM